jgi:hypothetical protein
VEVSLELKIFSSIICIVLPFIVLYSPSKK